MLYRVWRQWNQPWVAGNWAQGHSNHHHRTSITGSSSSLISTVTAKCFETWRAAARHSHPHPGSCSLELTLQKWQLHICVSVTPPNITPVFFPCHHTEHPPPPPPPSSQRYTILPLITLPYRDILLVISSFPHTPYLSDTEMLCSWSTGDKIDSL